jgi:hypothetical protein
VSRNRFGGIWAIHTAVLGSSSEAAAITADSMLGSVSSDGSVRLESRGSAVRAIFGGRDTSTRALAGSGSGAGGPRGEWGVFQVLEVEQQQEEGAAVIVRVDTQPSMPPAVGRTASALLNDESVASPQVAMHALHSCAFSAAACEMRLVAYGGAAGLVRLHTVQYRRAPSSSR